MTLPAGINVNTFGIARTSVISGSSADPQVSKALSVFLNIVPLGQQKPNPGFSVLDPLVAGMSDAQGHEVFDSIVESTTPGSTNGSGAGLLSPSAVLFQNAWQHTHGAPLSADKVFGDPNAVEAAKELAPVVHAVPGLGQVLDAVTQTALGHGFVDEVGRATTPGAPGALGGVVGSLDGSAQPAPQVPPSGQSVDGSKYGFRPFRLVPLLLIGGAVVLVAALVAAALAAPAEAEGAHT